METKFYYGAHKIVNIEDIENGYKRVELLFETPKENPDGSKDIGEKFDIPAWELTVCASFEPCSLLEHLGELRNRRTNYVVQKMLELFKELDVNIEEWPHYSQKLIWSMQANEEEAINKAFGVADKNDIRLSHWEKMLKK